PMYSGSTATSCWPPTTRRSRMNGTMTSSRSSPRMGPQVDTLTRQVAPAELGMANQVQADFVDMVVAMNKGNEVALSRTSYNANRIVTEELVALQSEATAIIDAIVDRNNEIAQQAVTQAASLYEMSRTVLIAILVGSAL